MDKEEIIERAIAGVKRAKGYCDNIEFSPEDAARTEPDFLCAALSRRRSTPERRPSTFPTQSAMPRQPITPA